MDNEIQKQRRNILEQMKKEAENKNVNTPNDEFNYMFHPTQSEDETNDFTINEFGEIIRSGKTK